MKSTSQRMQTDPRAGLTFLELLLAVAVSGLILMASSQILFSLAHFWHQTEQEPRFDRHMEGVVRFLEYAFDQTEDLHRRPDSRFGWSRPPGENGWTFHFRFAHPPPLFITEIRPLPPVDAWIAFEPDRGLSLLWHLPAALTEDKEVMRRTPLSFLVRDVEIGYYEKARNCWEFESLSDERQGPKRRRPGFLRIRFEQDGREQLRYVRMQPHARNVLIY